MMSSLTYLRYSSMTFSTGNSPLSLNTDTFHMAARANMTDEAPVALLKASMSTCVFTRSRDPPLRTDETHRADNNRRTVVLEKRETVLQFRVKTA